MRKLFVLPPSASENKEKTKLNNMKINKSFTFNGHTLDKVCFDSFSQNNNLTKFNQRYHKLSQTGLLGIELTNQNDTNNKGQLKSNNK